ncbi:MAG: hypothetical protein HZB46_06235, partial [Solirubrobacterales bacterium]|nr:hypothetical protein [Solirubrobacterales bacterium]
MSRFLLVSLLLLVLAAPAAGEAPPAEPDYGPVVAGPVEDVTLHAKDQRGQLCVTVSSPAPADEREFGDRASTQCGAIPLFPGDVKVEEHTAPDGERAWPYLVVPPDVLAVEFVDARGATVRATTSAGEAYRGRVAGRVRFALLPSVPVVRSGDERRTWTEARLLGEGDRLLGVLRESDGPVDVPSRVVTTLRGAGRTWPVRVLGRQALAPTTLDPGRTAGDLCLLLGARFSVSQCLPRQLRDPALIPAIEPACAARPVTIVSGLAGPAARAVSVLGTDGRRRTLRLHALPPALGPLRVVAGVLPADVGVRAMAVRTAAGTRTLRFALPPASLACREDDDPLSAMLTSPTFDLLYERPDAEPRLIVEDRGGLLCVGAGAIREGSLDCLPWWPTRSEPGLAFVASGFAGGAVLPTTTSVEVELADGRRVRGPATADAAGYAGAYRGQVRFFALRLPPRATVVAARAFTGARAVKLPVLAPNVVHGPVRRLLRSPSAPVVLSQARLAVPGAGLGVACYALTAPGAPVSRERCGVADAAGITVTALCAPRRLVLSGIAPRRATAVEAVLDDGRTLRTRPGPAAGGGRAF